MNFTAKMTLSLVVDVPLAAVGAHLDELCLLDMRMARLLYTHVQNFLLHAGDQLRHLSVLCHLLLQLELHALL